jgi:very-short-patch-repair endonuclease
VNASLAGRCRDFSWPDHGLVAEVDGHRWHSSKRARRRNARRDRELIAIGMRPVRFTYEEVAFEPDVVAGLRALLT